MKIHDFHVSTLLATAILLTPTVALAQSAMPQSKTWNFKEIIASDQYAAPPFRSIVQSRDGLVYVADNVGVLEFDGVKWSRLPLPDSRMVTSLGITEDSEVLVGGSEFLLTVSSEGQEVRIRDLAKEVPGGLVGLGHIWEFASGDGYWCVRSEPGYRKTHLQLRPGSILTTLRSPRVLAVPRH